MWFLERQAARAAAPTLPDEIVSNNTPYVGNVILPAAPMIRTLILYRRSYGS